MKSKELRLILEMGLISIVSFIGFNGAFLAAAAIILGIVRFVGPIGHLFGRPIFAVLLSVLCYFVLKSKLPLWLKASFYATTLMSLLVIVGIYFYALGSLWNTLLLALFIGGLIFMLIKTHKPWQYLFSTLFVGLCLAYVVLTGLDI